MSSKSKSKPVTPAQRRVIRAAMRWYYAETKKYPHYDGLHVQLLSDRLRAACAALSTRAKSAPQSKRKGRR